MNHRLFHFVFVALATILALGNSPAAWAGATCDQLAAQANNTWASLTNVLPGGTNSSRNTTLGSGGDLAPGEVLIFQVIPGPNFATATHATSNVSVGLLINGSNVFQFRTKVATTREFTIPAGATFPATVLFGILNFEAAATLSGQVRLGCRSSAGGGTRSTGGTGSTGGTADGTGNAGDGSGLTQLEKSQTVGNLVQSTIFLAAVMEAANSTGKDKAAALLSTPKFGRTAKLNSAQFRRTAAFELRVLEWEYHEIEIKINEAKGALRSAKNSLNNLIANYNAQRQLPESASGVDVFQRDFQSASNLASELQSTVDLQGDIIKSLERELNSLSKKIEKTKDNVTGFRSIEGDLPRVISLAFVQERHTGSWPTTNFALDLDRALNLGDGLTFDLWLKGTAAFLNDSSSANRDGYALRFALGGAYKLSDKFAVSAQISGGPGRVRINATDSQTTFNSYGLSMSGIMRFDDHLYGSITGFAEHNSHDIEFGPVTGSFDQTVYGVSGDIAGSYWLNALHFEPSAFAYYKHSDRGGFMDSGSTWIAGAKDSLGRLGAGLKVGRAFNGDGALSLFKPYVSARLNYNFNQQNAFNIGQGITITDSRFNAEIGGGIEAYFKRGILGTISVNYSGIGSTGLSVFIVNGGLKIPF